MSVTSWSVAEVVASFRDDSFLSKYADEVLASKISGEELVELTAADAVVDIFGIKSKFAVQKMTKAIGELIANNSGTLTRETKIHTDTGDTAKVGVQLPPNKDWEMPANKDFFSFLR